MKIGTFDTGEQVLIIAEIGNNHEGSFDVAAEMVDRAAEAGVNAVKFQTFKTDWFVAPGQTERYERMQGFELPQDEFARLGERAKAAGLLFISTPLDMPSAAFLDTVVDALKIASGDNDFYSLIEWMADTDKPLILSTGFADKVTIARSKALIDHRRAGRGGGSNLGILHCVSAYPVEPADANLGAIETLRTHFGDTTIGYSDHTLGIEAAALSVATGARIIEKHFTLDRNYSDFRDHQLSADPAMMTDLVAAVRRAETLLGDGLLDPRPVEVESMTPVRRSIAAVRNMEAGSVVGPDDIMCIRPGDGFRPGEETRVLGKALSRAIAKGDLFSPEDFSS